MDDYVGPNSLIYTIINVGLNLDLRPIFQNY